MFCDYHVHTTMSLDGKASLVEQAERASALGLTEICLTEHLEINFPDGKDWRVNVRQYVEEYRAMKVPGIRVKLGIEAGISCLPVDLPILEADLRSTPLDFVIASCHLVDQLDPYNADYFEGKTIQQAFAAYIHSIYECVCRIDPALYCAIGHIDYPSKGSQPFPDPRLRYAYAPDEIDTLFRKIIAMGKCIEINTSAYRKLGNLPIPGYDWLKRYVALGGEYVTIGSDAHKPEQVAYRLDDAVELARAAGIKYLATFEKMEPKFHRI